MYIIDGHQDLAWNRVTFERNYALSAREIRQLEAGGIAPGVNGETLLGWPEYQAGQVALVFGTLFAAPLRAKKGEWDTQVYETPEEAHAIYLHQLEEYYRIADDHSELFKLVFNQNNLDDLWRTREKADQPPVGIVILMEGAEGVRSPAELEMWVEKGVRILGPAWRGTRFCGGTREPGGLTREGRELLEAMHDHQLTLDVSHMDELAVLEALDLFDGPIIASHSNARSLIKNTDSNRFLTVRMIEGLLARDAVIGIVPFNPFLVGGWKIGDDRSLVSLDHVAAQIDTICQMAGDARHVGIGSDFDGGFGLSGVPAEIDTIADLQKLPPYLYDRGYSAEDVQRVMGQNWFEHLKETLPKG